MAATAGDERDWEDELEGIIASLAETTATCRHGNHRIHRTPRGTWEGEDGLEVCVKAPAGQIGHGQVPGYIVHEPRPVIA
jgi:hypothetical protein